MLQSVAAQHGARLCENVLGDPLTDSKRSFGWPFSPFEHKKG